jgi:hypothetical protein
MYTIFMLAVIVLPARSLTDDPVLLAFVNAVGMFLSAFITFCVIFIPKFYYAVKKIHLETSNVSSRGMSGNSLFGSVKPYKGSELDENARKEDFVHIIEGDGMIKALETYMTGCNDLETLDKLTNTLKRSFEKTVDTSFSLYLPRMRRKNRDSSPFVRSKTPPTGNKTPRSNSARSGHSRSTTARSGSPLLSSDQRPSKIESPQIEVPILAGPSPRTGRKTPRSSSGKSVGSSASPLLREASVNRSILRRASSPLCKSVPIVPSSISPSKNLTPSKLPPIEVKPKSNN